MEELLEILEGIAPGEDFENCTTLIDDHILDSFAILSLVSEIEDTFDVEIEQTKALSDELAAKIVETAKEFKDSRC